jgi:hypothetical protein
VLPDTLVLDTCVLISNVLRRAVLELARQSCLRVAWSPIIGDEWRRNAARLWGVAPEAIARQWQDLQLAFPEADQGDVEPFKTGLKRSDPKDWHVVAAARCVAEHHPASRVGVLTRNLRDFNRSELRSFGIDLLDPDLFLVRCLALYPEAVRRMLSELPQAVVAPGRTVEPLETLLRRERLFRLNRLIFAGAA